MASTDPSVIPAPPVAPADEKLIEAAYRRVKPELDAVEPDNYLKITKEPTKVAMVGWAAAPRMQQYREVVVEHLPTFDISKLDNLRDYALAVFYTDSVAGPAPVDAALAALVDDATETRERMLSAAATMVVFGVLDEGRVAKLRSGNGYIDLAKDIIGLSAMFKQQWSQLQGQQPVTREEVDRAFDVGTELMLALSPKALRTQLGERTSNPVDAGNRIRAFTLFVNIYDACRRAIAYIRHDHGDAESIAPTLFFRPRRRSSAEPAEEAPPASNGALTP
jgi:hypothetical protein